MAGLARILYAVTLIGFLGHSAAAIGAAAGKGGANEQGRALEQMSLKGALNNNAQWSADPVRGWVRADERKKMEEKTATGNSIKKNDKRTEKRKSKNS